MKIKKLESFKSSDVNLTPFDLSELPFTPQRLLVIKNSNKGIGYEESAHLENRQYLICLKGIIKIITHDGKKYDKSILTEGYSTLIEPYHWNYHESMTGDDVLLIACSNPFDREDYISDFSEFVYKMKELNREKKKVPNDKHR